MHDLCLARGFQQWVQPQQYPLIPLTPCLATCLLLPRRCKPFHRQNLTHSRVTRLWSEGWHPQTLEKRFIPRYPQAWRRKSRTPIWTAKPQIRPGLTPWKTQLWNPQSPPVAQPCPKSMNPRVLRLESKVIKQRQLTPVKIRMRSRRTFSMSTPQSVGQSNFTSGISCKVKKKKTGRNRWRWPRGRRTKDKGWESGSSESQERSGQGQGQSQGQGRSWEQESIGQSQKEIFGGYQSKGQSKSHRQAAPQTCKQGKEAKDSQQRWRGHSSPQQHRRWWHTCLYGWRTRSCSWRPEKDLRRTMPTIQANTGSSIWCFEKSLQHPCEGQGSAGKHYGGTRVLWATSTYTSSLNNMLYYGYLWVNQINFYPSKN